jgi:protein O-mannosyl-transferase
MRSSRQFVIVGLFLVAGFIAFASIINSYFLSDDFAQIGRVLAGDLSVVWGKAHGGFFRPLFIFSYLIDTKIWGARPFGFHLTNIIFHSLNAFLTFKLTRRMIADLTLTTDTRKAISIGAGTLFLLHPSHTEAVSWISGRADLIATFFCLASLLWFVAYARDKRFSRIALSLSCFALALLAKESAICLPFLVAVTGVFMGNAGKDRRTRGKFLAVIALYLLILLAFIAVRSVFIGSLVGGYGVSQHLNFSPRWLRDRLLEASVRSVLPTLPAQLSLFLFKPLQSRVFILFSIACCGLVATAIMLRRRWYEASERRAQNRFLLVLVALFLLSLLPAINLRLSLYQTLGERFLYLPSVFSCLLIAYLLAILLRQTRLLLLAIICILGFYSVRLYQTNQTWREAAQLSRSIKDELVDSATHDRLVVLNAPDNLRGVPVFHNGLPEALAYFQDRKHVEQVEIIAFQNLQSLDDQVQLSRASQSLTIKLLNNDGNFERVDRSECLEVITQTKTSLELRATLCSADADLVFFDRGRMTRVLDR